MKAFTTYSPDKFTGTFNIEALKHLLKRSLLGVSWENIKKFEGKSLDTVITEVFKEDLAPLPPINHYENIVKDTTNIKFGETWVNSVYPPAPNAGDVNSRRKQSLNSWYIQRMQFQEATIHEKMILFWHNHFATEIETYSDARFGYKYINTIRKYSLGNFKDFVKAMTLEPAMLNYLNGRKNTKAAPDENYARELQELFTVGKGPNSKYTESDVKQAAKILTGYEIVSNTIDYRFNANNHDVTDKTFSAFYNSKTIKGQTGDNGRKELDELLTMIFATNEISLHIIRKLYIYFFYFDITPEVEKQFIVPLAAIFKNSDYQILPVLKAMLSSKHFFDVELRSAMIKSPIEHLMSTTRGLETVWPKYESANYQEYYQLGSDLVTIANNGQQAIFDPPSVAGWPAYYQAPVYQKIWINASTLPVRVKFGEGFVKTGLKRNNKVITVDIIATVKKFPNPEDPNKLIDSLEFLFFQIPLDAALKKQLKTDILLEGQASDYYWTELWTEQQQKPTTNNTNMVVNRLKNLIIYLISLPEYQLS